MIKICHASISENGTVKNAKAGDQTGKEVCVRDWYAKGWNVMLRHPNETIAMQSANIAKMLADSSLVGYDQLDRNTLHNALKHYNYDVGDYLASGEKTETDCSAFVTACYIAAGVKTLEYKVNAPTTSTMEKTFKNAGFEAYKQSRYLTSDEYLKKGDILVKAGSHTVICIESGARASALITDLYYFNVPPIKTLSLVDALASIGADGSKAYRARIWGVNNFGGIYTGSAPQNEKMLKELYKGYLLIP